MSEPFIKLNMWMATDLHLTGNELIVFAVIHSFTVAGRGYDGGLDGLAKWTGSSARAVSSVLDRLISKGVIEKITASKGRVSNLFLSKINHEESSRLNNEENSGLTMKNLHPNHEESSYDKKDKKDINITPSIPLKGGSANADARSERTRRTSGKRRRAVDIISSGVDYSAEGLRQMGISQGEEFYDSLDELRIE